MSAQGSAPLVMLPGLLCDSRIFAGQLARFPGALAIDGFDRCNSLGAMADLALANTPPRISLLGHSMGARVALEMLRRAPDRIERLALFSTGVHLPRPGEADQRHALLRLGQERGIAALVDAWLTPMIAPANRHPALKYALRAMCEDLGVDAFATQIAALLDRPEVESLLPSIRCPTLVATGSEDVWSAPDQHRPIADAIAGAVLCIVDGAGHMVPAERPAALNHMIADWLAMPAPAHTDTRETLSIGEAR